MTKKAELTPLEKAHIAIAKKRVAGELKMLNPIEKANKNPNSLRLAINGKCYDCGGQDEPNWRKRIKYCNIIGCTLHPVRPYSKGVTNQECLNWQEVVRHMDAFEDPAREKRDAQIAKAKAARRGFDEGRRLPPLGKEIGKKSSGLDRSRD